MGRPSGARTTHGKMAWEFYLGAVGQTAVGMLRGTVVRGGVTRWAYRSAVARGGAYSTGSPRSARSTCGYSW
jgi:hypothetical protein